MHVAGRSFGAEQVRHSHLHARCTERHGNRDTFARRSATTGKTSSGVSGGLNLSGRKGTARRGTGYAAPGPMASRLVQLTRPFLRRLIAPATVVGALLCGIVVAEPPAAAAVSVYVAPPLSRREVIPLQPSPRHVWNWGWRAGTGPVWRLAAGQSRPGGASGWEATGPDPPRRWDYAPGHWPRVR